MPLLILDLGGSAIHLGLVALAQFAPVFVLAPLGGVVADRVDKRRTLLGLQLLLMALGAAVSALTWLGTATIPVCIMVCAAYGLIGAVEQPTRQAFVSELVPRSALANAIVLQQAAYNATRIVGPALAAVALSAIGVSLTFALAALMSGAAVGLVSAIGQRTVLTPSTTTTLRAALGRGTTYAMQTVPVRRGLLIIFGTSALVVGVQTLLPLYAASVLGLGAAGYGSLLAALGVGTVFAAGPMSIARAMLAHRVIAVALTSLAVLLAALAVASVAPLPHVLVAMVGMSSAAAVASANVAIQSAVDDAMRGRVMGLYIACYSGGVAAGSVILSLIAENTSVFGAILVSAACAGALAIWWIVAGLLDHVRNRNAVESNAAGGR